jgi:hypothetical protein
MATSGTAVFNPDILAIIEEAFEQAGSEMRSGYDLRTARRSLDLIAQEWSNRGFNLWTVEAGTQALTPGTATYTLPADTIDLVEHLLRTDSGNTSLQSDYHLERISLSSYSDITSKLQQGRPLQIYIDRQRDAPEVTVWPEPDSTQTYTLAYHRIRRIEDAGIDGTNTYDVPSRFIPALTAALAFRIAMKKPELQQRVPFLQTEYERQWNLAAGEDRVKASVRFVPHASYRL